MVTHLDRKRGFTAVEGGLPSCVVTVMDKKIAIDLTGGGWAGGNGLKRRPKGTPGTQSTQSQATHSVKSPVPSSEHTKF